MKPGKHDRQYHILITGAELQELQRHTARMAESYGLDVRIERYKGKRTLGLYRWDLECLLDVMETALADREDYPSPDSPGYEALKALKARLRAAYDELYGKNATT
ncbi:MAG: hypothetical protein HYZ81_12035 [Nitrospinae bacterium]|nr:hypothetical protein [Nitrospinota bacterium]